MTRAADRPLSGFSGGMRRRLDLAASLVHRPSVLFLDEPTTGLHFEDMRKLLVVLNRLVEAGNTVVVIEHNLDVIKTADHIVDITNAHVIEDLVDINFGPDEPAPRLVVARSSSMSREARDRKYDVMTNPHPPHPHHPQSPL